MARSGINKAQVKLALERLKVRGESPSIDAVRIELGNTGSKSTISKYLLELKEESSSLSKAKVNLSNTLGELVEELATQLQKEADDIVDKERLSIRAAMANLQEKNEQKERALVDASRQIDVYRAQLESSQQKLSGLNEELQGTLLKVERLTQELKDKDAQLAAKDTHIESLEEKHLHGRHAMEHYRESVKTQREQELQRHETQVQQLQVEIRQLNQTISIKQTDITQLNKENSRFTTELNEIQKQLRTAEYNFQSASSKLKANEENNIALRGSLTEMEKIRTTDLQKINELQQQLKTLEHSSQSMQIELITTKTELTVKNQLFESLNLRLQ